MKKNIKIITSVIAALAVSLGAFAGCGNNDAVPQEDIAEAEVQVSETSEITEEATEAPSIEATENKTSSTSVKSDETAKTSKLLTAEKNDQKTLAGFMEYILGYSGVFSGKEPPCDENGYSMKDYFDYNYRDYDSSASGAFKQAFGGMYGNGSYSLYDDFDETYDIDADSYYTEFSSWDEDKKFERDPLKKFDEEFDYRKCDGKKFDMFLEEIFNVTPNHDYVAKSEDEDNMITAYYSNGYYYLVETEGGDGAGPKVIVNKLDKQTDGKYIADITFRWGNDDEGFSDVAKLKTTVALKNIDGHRMWSLYSIKRA